VIERDHKPWRAALALAVCGVGTLWFVTARGDEPDPSRAVAAVGSVAGQVDLRRMQSELERLRSDLASAERRIAVLEIATPERGAADSATLLPSAAAGAPLGEAAANAAAASAGDDQRAQVARAFDAESDDASWNPDAEIKSVVQAALPAGSTVRSLQCRSSLCRVETSHPDEQGQAAYVNSLSIPRPGSTRPFKGVLFDGGERTADGRELRSVTYVVRRGYAFPGAGP
jgi:hypothetical protein